MRPTAIIRVSIRSRSILSVKSGSGTANSGISLASWRSAYHFYLQPSSTTSKSPHLQRNCSMASSQQSAHGLDRRLGILLFENVERDDVAFRGYLEPLGYKTIFIGINGGKGTSYLYTPRVVKEETKQAADIDISEATQSAFGKLDILLIPGGIGALGQDEGKVESVGKLAENASWVLAFSLGANLLASTGKLNGRAATTHHTWAGEDFNKRWPNVEWKSKDKLVRAGKYFTAHHLSVKSMQQTAQELVTAIGLPVQVRQLTDTNIDFNPSVSEPPAPDPFWKSTLERLHEVAKKKIAEDGVEVSAEVQEADPFVRGPASESQIRDAEARLGVTLPEDYKKFLLNADGIGFTGTVSVQSLKRAAELQWNDAEEAGLESLKLEVVVDGEKHSTDLPYQRLILISDDEEEAVYLVEPQFVRRAKQDVVVKTGKSISEDSSNWSVFLFVPWAARYEQFDSFTDYVQYVLKA